MPMCIYCQTAAYRDVIPHKSCDIPGCTCQHRGSVKTLSYLRDAAENDSSNHDKDSK